MSRVAHENSRMERLQGASHGLLFAAACVQYEVAFPGDLVHAPAAPAADGTTATGRQRPNHPFERASPTADGPLPPAPCAPRFRLQPPTPLPVPPSLTCPIVRTTRCVGLVEHQTAPHFGWILPTEGVPLGRILRRSLRAGPSQPTLRGLRGRRQALPHRLGAGHEHAVAPR